MDNMLKIRQTLTDSIFEVFERMFYVFLEPVDRQDGEYHYRACINFSGAIAPINGISALTNLSSAEKTQKINSNLLSGELTAVFSRPLAETMLKNMLNVGGNEINEGLMGDCLKESVNMICGNFLSKYDSGQVFDLSIPTYTSGNQFDVIKVARDSEAAVRLDLLGGQGRLLVIMII